MTDDYEDLAADASPFPMPPLEDLRHADRQTSGESCTGMTSRLSDEQIDEIRRGEWGGTPGVWVWQLMAEVDFHRKKDRGLHLLAEDVLHSGVGWGSAGPLVLSVLSRCAGSK